MMKNKKMMRLILVLTLVASAPLAWAYDPTKVPEKKRTTLGLYLDVQEAYDLAAKGHALFLDVRTRAEVNFLGMPTLADANIPYMVMDNMFSWNAKKNAFRLEPNSDFVSAVEKRLQARGLTKNDPVIVMCRSGDRSATAANLLSQAGYTKVYSVIDGFEGDMSKDGRRVVNGWKNAGLPWSYKLDREKMYAQ